MMFAFCIHYKNKQRLACYRYLRVQISKNNTTWNLNKFEAIPNTHK
jgi:hypothetical protein